MLPSSLVTKVSGFLNDNTDFKDMQSAICPDDMQLVLACLGHPPGREETRPDHSVFLYADTGCSLRSRLIMNMCMKSPTDAFVRQK